MNLVSLSLLKASKYAPDRSENVENVDVILKMVDKFCRNLSELEINVSNIHENILYENRSIFKRLKNSEWTI